MARESFVVSEVEDAILRAESNMGNKRLFYAAQKLIWDMPNGHEQERLQRKLTAVGERSESSKPMNAPF